MEAQQQFDDVVFLLKELCILESTAKASPPSTKMLFLGIQLDSIKQTMEIDAVRLKNIKAEIAHWMGKKYAMLKQVQSTFKNKGFHKVPVGVRKDLNCQNIFAQDFNGIAAILSLNWEQPDSVFSTDACLTGGGGWNKEQYFHFKFPESIIQQGKYINHFELYTVMIATQLWAPSFAGMNILIYCDNEATVQIL